MSDDRISEHEVRLLLAFERQRDRWLTNGELAEAAKVSPRTARNHTARLAELGVLEVERIFPSNKYRLAAKPGDPAQDYLQRWLKAREVFGM